MCVCVCAETLPLKQAAGSNGGHFKAFEFLKSETRPLINIPC